MGLPALIAWVLFLRLFHWGCVPRALDFAWEIGFNPMTSVMLAAVQGYSRRHKVKQVHTFIRTGFRQRSREACWVLRAPTKYQVARSAWLQSLRLRPASWCSHCLSKLWRPSEAAPSSTTLDVAYGLAHSVVQQEGTGSGPKHTQTSGSKVVASQLLGCFWFRLNHRWRSHQRSGASSRQERILPCRVWCGTW